jgi:outer membrane protein OmpA-like peptidoglycan-associated protein
MRIAWWLGALGVGTLGVGTLALASCGGGEPATSAAASPGAAAEANAASPGQHTSPGAGGLGAAATGSTGGRTIAWQDPEPADAQARAEAALALDSGRGKTTRLAMHITTLVDRRTGLVGPGRSAISGKTRSLEDRLTALNAEITETEVVIRLPGSVLFDFDSDTIRPDAERTLAELAAVLEAQSGRPVRIEGHTDSIASDAYNLDLSRRRAEAVKRWLVAHGAKAAGLTSLGLGESRPVADNGTAAGRQLNRRVEVIMERRGG